MNIHWKDWCWSWSSNTLATWCEELTHWRRPWCWERLKVGGEGDDRGWGGWVAPCPQRTWVWANSRDNEGQESRGVAKRQTRLSDWIAMTITVALVYFPFLAGSLLCELACLTYLRNIFGCLLYCFKNVLYSWFIIVFLFKPIYSVAHKHYWKWICILQSINLTLLII